MGCFPRSPLRTAAPQPPRVDVRICSPNHLEPWADSKTCPSGLQPVKAIVRQSNSNEPGSWSSLEIMVGAGRRFRLPPEVTAQMVATIDSGRAAINVLADVADATVRLVDMAVGRAGGNIAVEDALTPDEAIAALEAGRQVADEEVDAGADLVIVGDLGIGNTTAATTLVAALTNTEPVAAVGRGTGIDDSGWARKTAAVRDALYRVRGSVRTPWLCWPPAVVPISQRWPVSAPRPPYAVPQSCSTAWW